MSPALSGLSWNLFNGGATGYRVEALERGTHAGARAEAKRPGAQIRETIDKAFAAYVIGKKRVEAAQQQVNSNDRAGETVSGRIQAREAQPAGFARFRNGALFNSQFQLASAKAVRLFSAYNIQASTGRLLATLSVQAPPEAHIEIPDRREAGGILPFDIEPLRQD